MGARALFRPVSGAGVYKAREGACDGVDGKDTGTGRGALLWPFPWPQSAFAETGPGAPCGDQCGPRRRDRFTVAPVVPSKGLRCG